MEEGETTDRDSELRGQVQSRASEVEALIKRGQLKPALLKALQSPPVLARDRSIKDLNAATVQSAVAAIPEAQIDGMLDDMPDEGYDVLMKYLYRLLASSYASVPGQQPLSGLLLKWHEKLASKTGPGSIVRALTDRKTV